jgi:hypothetical protein
MTQMTVKTIKVERLERISQNVKVLARKQLRSTSWSCIYLTRRIDYKYDEPSLNVLLGRITWLFPENALYTK